jgi:glycosyltransferase involved in cell wall biosynthesis
MCAVIDQLVSQEHFDVAFLTGRRTYPAFKVLRGLPVVFDVCDAASMRIRASIRYSSLGRQLLRFIDYLLTRRIELKLTQNATHLLFASSRDRDALIGRRRSNHSTVVSNGVDLEFWKRRSPLLGEKTIIFTGVMSYSPNSDAALYLIEEVLPIVQQSVPDARLLIVGRNPPSSLVEAGRRTGVEVTGFVEDVRPYLERATVFAAPLRFGAGIQNKILEAMAMEVPVVASPLAAAGLRSAEGGDPPIEVAEGRQQFAERIIGHLLVGDEGKANSPDAEGRRFVERYFSWKGSGERLERVIEDIVLTKGQQNVQWCAYQP